MTQNKKPTYIVSLDPAKKRAGWAVHQRTTGELLHSGSLTDSLTGMRILKNKSFLMYEEDCFGSLKVAWELGRCVGRVQCFLNIEDAWMSGVRTNTWRKWAYGTSKGSRTKLKEMACEKTGKKDDNEAEAILIGRYALALSKGLVFP